MKEWKDNVLRISYAGQVCWQFTSVPLDESSEKTFSLTLLSLATSYSTTSMVAISSVMKESVSLVSRQTSAKAQTIHFVSIGNWRLFVCKKRKVLVLG